MSDTNALLLDYGGVVADHYCQPATAKLASLLDISETEMESLVSERTRHGAALRLNKISPEEFWDTIAKQLPRKDLSFDWRTAQQLWAETYVPNQEVLALMRTVREVNGWTVGILSNMDRLRFHYVEGLFNWSVYCDCLVGSWQIGSMKPDLRFYEMAIQRLGYEGRQNEVIYVDDKADHVVAARKVGCRAVVFESPTILRHQLLGA